MGSLGKWELVSYINGRCSTCHFEGGGGGGGGKSPVFVLHCLSAQTSRSCCCLVPVRALGKKLKKAPSSC